MALILSVLPASLTGVAFSQTPTPVTSVNALDGLEQPVEILRDRWGISHIYASTEADLFFAQGYSAARDRLFQFEMWRMQATGTAAKVFGRGELQRDFGARLHQFRGDLRKEMNRYHPRGAAIIEAFVRGVNAHIAETERDPGLLPVEFNLLGIKPERWTAQVVISRHQGLLGNVRSELQLTQAVRAIGADRVKKLMSFQGGEPVLTPDPALNLAEIPDGVLDVYNAFRGPLRFTPQQVAAAHRNDEESYRRLALQLADGVRMLEPRHGIGSNNWVIHGSRTLSTFPIMANDPHRAITVPSLRYWVHLIGPGWNAIGAGEPVLPGISIGHNEHGAWGLTVFGSDTEDLYVYDTNPADPGTYRYRGRWEAMRVLKDSIAVRGEEPVIVEYKYTRHGPVLFEDKARHKAYALRAAWMEEGGAPYLASLRMGQARSWKEFREACEFNHIPAESMVWADRKGNIGFQAAGIQPLRPNWSGLLPVPGDGRYEWKGYLPVKSLPSETNPARGFRVTANNYLAPRDFPFPEAMYFEWDDPYRASRIEEVLGSGRVFSIADVMQLQNDDLSLPARALVPMLSGLALDGPVAQARDRLKSWDLVLDQGSVAAGIYERWQRRLLVNFRGLVLGDAAPGLGGLEVSMRRMIDALTSPGGEFGADPIAARDALLVRSLAEAVTELTQRFGPDPSGWVYGQQGYHHSLITHPMSAAVGSPLRARLDVGPAPRGGDDYTVTATGGEDRQMSGGSFKIIVDTEDWDNSVGQNTPGQSGDPSSPHYRDLFDLWAQGKYFPVAFSRAKVESVKESLLQLRPADR
jgi:penicillin amidase